MGSVAQEVYLWGVTRLRHAVLLGCTLCSPHLVHAAAKVHIVTLGPVRRVPFVAADVAREAKEDEAGTLRIRGLYVDDKLREWTTGDQHDVPDRA